MDDVLLLNSRTAPVETVAELLKSATPVAPPSVSLPALTSVLP